MNSFDQQDVLTALKEREQTTSPLDAALAIAAREYPGLKATDYRRLIDEWSVELKGQLPENPSLEDRLRTLNHFMFDEKGFSGNIDDYYDPRNSFINEVIDRRVGIPITLSVVYIELGRRIDLPLEGVSFPGHFLVKLPVYRHAVVLDPFNRGVSLDEHDLEEMLSEYFDTEVDDLGSLLQAASTREIVMRLLRNLKGIYLAKDELPKALEVMNLMLSLDETQTTEYRDRGLVLASLECYQAASTDLVHYLELAREADDADQIRETLIQLKSESPSLH
ncbi:MAG: tetratricopeptide repeat protein [Gammaproteobacteria bacterium]